MRNICFRRLFLRSTRIRFYKEQYRIYIYYHTIKLINYLLYLLFTLNTIVYLRSRNVGVIVQTGDQ